MLKFVSEYELVKENKHETYKYVKDLFASKKICSQNFHKFYRRYIASGRDNNALLPVRRGPKPKYMETAVCPEEEVFVSKILEYRKRGANKYFIASAISKDETIKKTCSASTIYRILVKHGVSRLKAPEIIEKRRIVREKAGELLHIDCHYLPKGVVKEFPTKQFYVVGAIDDYSRVCWVEVIQSTKAIDATFGMMDIILGLNQRYGITAAEAMTDNGSEFCGNNATHPFERLLQHFAIKHIRTKPYRPQTNGKIERFWRSFDDEVMDGVEFEHLDQLKDAVLGYVFYYNEHRPHQSLDGKTPLAQLAA
jgi:transposase InsO family protein